MRKKTKIRNKFLILFFLTYAVFTQQIDQKTAPGWNGTKEAACSAAKQNAGTSDMYCTSRQKKHFKIVSNCNCTQISPNPPNNWKCTVQFEMACLGDP